jgi:hypothetical protein
MVVPLVQPDPGAEARALLRAILDHGDVMGTDMNGRTVLALAVDDWTLDRLATFDAATTDDEDDGAGEPDGVVEIGWQPVHCNPQSVDRPRDR